jgi:hypothetical protein
MPLLINQVAQLFGSAINVPMNHHAFSNCGLICAQASRENPQICDNSQFPNALGACS